ncbi:MAG: GntR family transcriptional regulator [Planctomycetota bacterium]
MTAQAGSTVSTRKGRKRHNALSDTVYENLYAKIVSGRLKPGERITEQDVAEAEGISRAPVREALKRLAQDRLVELVPRSACYVRRLTRDDVEDLFAIRRDLERLAMQRAFGRFDIAEIESIRGMFTRCLDLDDRRLARRELALDVEFHRLIYVTSGSVVIQDMLDKLWARVQVLRAREAMRGNRAKVALEGHIAILDAILEEDRRQALRLLKEHIEEARRYALSTLVAGSDGSGG